MTTKDKSEKKPGKGIYLLPNLFTTAGLFSGFYSILAAMNGDFSTAAVAIFIAMIMDGLDGRVARLTNTTSKFGMEYDSLTDMLAFGVAPALVCYLWALDTFGSFGPFGMKIGWLIAFVYVAGTALRLARFNAQIGVADKDYFQGLPSPSAAALVAGMIWFGNRSGFSGAELSLPAAFVTISAGVLMVSNVRYSSFKSIDFRGKISFVKVLLLALAFIVIALDPALVVFLGFLIYVVSGPVLTVVGLRKRREVRRSRGGVEGEQED